MIDLFVYGTLMHQKIFERVTHYKGSEDLFKNSKMAYLTGYEACYVVNEYYPGLRQREKGKTEGMILNVPPDLLEFLFQYEGPEDYDLVSKTLTLKKSGEIVEARLFLNTGKLNLTNNLWSYPDFIKKGEDQKILEKLSQWIQLS